MRAGALAGATLALAAGGCMPWAVAQTADTVSPGRVEGGLALSVLAPPDRLDRPFAVPQLRVATGLRHGMDVAGAYAPPLTFHGRVKVRVADRTAGAAALSAGLGVHGLPDVLDFGQGLWTPFLTAAAYASAHPSPARPYGSFRIIVPFLLGPELTAIAWLAPQAGLELRAGWLRWGPELGAVVPLLHPRETQLVLALWAAWPPALP